MVWFILVKAMGKLGSFRVLVSGRFDITCHYRREVNADRLNEVLMPTDAATTIAYVGAFVGLVGGGVSLFNARKAVCWKRAELANTYLKDFNNSSELVFAGRCLDWNGGKLILPESLQPYMPDGEKVIVHDRVVFARALSQTFKSVRWIKTPESRSTERQWTPFSLGCVWLLALSTASFSLSLTFRMSDTGSRRFKARSFFTRSLSPTDTRKA